ncbi:MAG: nucleotidyltransferase family protein [Armatimonadia bacterium]
MTTREMLQEKREEILALAAKHKAKHVRVFGSVVRGEDGPESDVDFLVDFEDEASLFDQIGLIQDLEDLLGRKVDVVEDGYVHWVIQDKVRQEARAL